MRPLALFALLAGCPHPVEPVQVPAPQVFVTPPAPEPTPPSALNAVLATAGWALALPRERQVEEIDRWSVAVARDDLPTDRLRLALLLALGDPSVRDPDRVRELLRGQWYDGDDLGAESLARLVLEVVEAREESATTRLRLTLELERERTRSAELQSKLDALQTIEVEMEARDRAIVEEGDGTDPGGR